MGVHAPQIGFHQVVDDDLSLVGGNPQSFQDVLLVAPQRFVIQQDHTGIAHCSAGFLRLGGAIEQGELGNPSQDAAARTDGQANVSVPVVIDSQSVVHRPLHGP